MKTFAVCNYRDKVLSWTAANTEEEMYDILGIFSIVLTPESLPLTEEELSKFTYFRPLAEYTNEYGIALEESDVPLKEQND